MGWIGTMQQHPAPRPLDPAEALAFWFGRINYEQRAPQPADLKLERMLGLLEHLGNPHHALRVVHIAGSKGKGSTSALLASVLSRAGYRTGLFTSPHLCRVEERIRIDGKPIQSDELTALLNLVCPAVRAMDREGDPSAGTVTFFEVATALCFLHFARRGVDVAVLEVGLGGRFDSTNVVRPIVAMITSISYDHTRQLGNRLSQIAMEKAGIVKPGRPALSAARVAEARQVIEAICRERGAPLRQLDHEIHHRHRPGRITEAGIRPARVQVETDRRSWPEMELGLLGEHQAANAALVVAAVEHLQEEGYRITDEAVSAGLARVVWPARFEVLGRHPLVILDCAHNVASAQALVDTLEQSLPKTAAGDSRIGRSKRGRRILVFASSSDKDLPGMLKVLAPHFSEVYLTAYSHNPRRVPPEELAGMLRRVADVPHATFEDPVAAWQAARAGAGADDVICVTGSVFLAGELRPVLASND
jgi:dihydrofolate synthase/folylpolyglutamate synthase